MIGFAKITRDITERREAQLALEQTQLALFQSQKMEAIGQLTGGVAHDFNNLLMAILGSLELLRKRLPDAEPKVTALLDNAVQAANRGAALTQRMLAFARRQELKPDIVDLGGLVRGMYGLLERSVDPTVALEPKLPRHPAAGADRRQPARGRPDQSGGQRQGRHARGREITIAARLAQVTAEDALALKPGRYIRLSVSDTGMGMDEDTAARASEPFFTTKGVGKGTGLGLSMVHGLAEQSGGRMRLQSQPGQGTTVELWLPLAPEGAQVAERAPSDEAADRTCDDRLVVLVVDDDGLVLANTAAMLDDLGHRVIEAASGPDALALLAHEPCVDLMITDQVMPGMTGLQLAAKVRAERPGLPILLATGYAEMPASSDPTLTRLAKPFTQSQLADAVGAAAQRRKKPA